MPNCPCCGGYIPAGTTERRGQFEQMVYTRLAEYGIGAGKCTPTNYKAYQGIRHLDNALHGTVANQHRLSECEFARLVKLLDRILPPQQPT